MDDNIYLILQGRIGNQLFQYAFARTIQKKYKPNSKIIMDDSRILNLGWDNLLSEYDLPNVEYVHKNIFSGKAFLSYQNLVRTYYRLVTRHMSFQNRYLYEKKLNEKIGKKGMFICDNGFIDQNINYNNAVYIEGFFQSEKYFETNKEDIVELFNSKQFLSNYDYPMIDKIRNRNSICISVKVEHNVGSSMYSVCGVDYWKEAIQYIINNVDNPLFFICSDNTDYVLENLIDTSKYDYVVQDKKSPVHVSLAAMSECKHFIIGNTTFGWWAQYLSKNPDKIVVAPSKWMAVDMPIDIYQDRWTLIDVLKE